MRHALLSPLDHLRAFCAAVRTLRDAAFDARVEAIEALVRVVEGETIEAFANAAPARAADVALELGRRHWDHWANMLEVAEGLARDLGLSDADLVDAFDEAGPGVWRLLFDNAREWLPALPRQARVDLRATAALNVAVLERMQKAELAEGLTEYRKILAANGRDAEPEAVRLTIYIQALSIGGVTARIPGPMLEALALELWRFYRDMALRDLKDENLVEDSYFAAEQAERDAEDGSERVSLAEHDRRVAEEN